MDYHLQTEDLQLNFRKKWGFPPYTTRSNLSIRLEDNRQATSQLISYSCLPEVLDKHLSRKDQDQNKLINFKYEKILNGLLI